MLFVLGVMVGKRIESRGQAEAPRRWPTRWRRWIASHQPPPGVAAPEPALTFPRTLAGGPRPRRRRPKAKPTAPRPRRPPPVPKLAAAASRSRLAAGRAAPVARAGRADRPGDACQGQGQVHAAISTFATSAEADAFAQRFPGAFVISGAVPGKGMVYRVRYGNFGSFKEATAAKDGFEKQHNMIALVAAR